MSSRLNPREYDLGELRDAVRETERRRDRRRDEGDADPRRDRRETPALDAGGKAGRRSRSTPGREARRRSSDRPESGTDSARGSDERRASGRSGGGSDRRRSADSGAEAARPASGAEPRSRPYDRPHVGRMRRETAQRDGRESRSGGPSRGGDRRTPLEARTRPRQPTSRRPVDGRGGGNGGAAWSDVELLARVSGGDVERPYLARLPDEYGAQMAIFDWLEGLLTTCGHEATLEALSYYESIGWLSAESRESLEAVAEGLAASAPPEPRPLDVDDHRESLRYVARLAHRAYR